jgi:heavy metal sensor kinase
MLAAGVPAHRGSVAMFDSVRVRLTLWYSGVLAIILIALSLVTYIVLARTTSQRTNASLAELAFALRSSIQTQYNIQSPAPDSLLTATKAAIVSFQLLDHHFAVLTPDGQILSASESYYGARANGVIGVRPALSSAMRQAIKDAASHSNRPFQDLKIGRAPLRAYTFDTEIGGTKLTIVVMQSLKADLERLKDLTHTFLWAIPITVLFASAGGYFLARKSLAPVAAMSDQASRMGAENLHERLPVPKQRDELGQLALTFNSLLERLDHSFERQRQFMADASHELRSPVAIIRGEAQVTLSQSSRSPAEYRESLAIALDEARRLSCVVEDLFTLARADAGQYPLRVRDFYLEELVADCVRTARCLATARGVTLSHLSGGEMLLHADEELIRQMAMNLLDNAIKYTPEGGTVTLECKRVGMEYSLSVIDTGPGIPSDAHERVFERFFRLDKARSHTQTERAGAGLGLSIARWIAEAHQGRLKLLRSDSSGSVFVAYVPSGEKGFSAETDSLC